MEGWIGRGAGMAPLIFYYCLGFISTLCWLQLYPSSLALDSSALCTARQMPLHSTSLSASFYASFISPYLQNGNVCTVLTHLCMTSTRSHFSMSVDQSALRL